MDSTKRLGFGKYGDLPLSKVPLYYLQWCQGEFKNKNPLVEDELRRRGLNTKQLRELEWNHDQSKWKKAAAEARESQRSKKKRARKRRAKKNKRQRQVAVTARVKSGFTVVGERFVPAQATSTFPF